MSFEDEIQAMRDRKVEPAPFEHLAQKEAAAPQMPRRRLSIAAAGTVCAALAFLVLFLRPAIGADVLSGGKLRLQVAALLPMFVLLWAFRRLSQPRLGAQLLCRAVWWSSLVVGLLISLNYGETPDKILGAIIAVASAAALLSVGERGLDVQDADSPFAPVRFRGHLLLALVMAAADALTLAFSGLLQLRLGMRGWNLLSTLDHAGPTILAAIVMGVAVWGVYRLRTWALLLNLIANIAIAYLALEGTLGLSPSVSVSLATTAAIQCFIPVPILAAALGDRNSGQPLLHSLRHRLMNFTVLALAAASVLAIAVSGGDGWVDGPGRSFIRGMGASKEHHREYKLYVMPPLRTPRERLGAESDDLRGRDFDGQSLSGDFSGADFRGASLRGAGLSATNLDGADLRDVDFTRADFGGGLATRPRSAKAVLVHGADFSGAQIGGEYWKQLAEGGLEGVRCPDGTLATSGTGCDGHLGRVATGFRRSFRYAQTSTRGSVACAREESLTVAFEQDGVLLHRKERYVQLANGDFVSSLSRIHELEDGRWEVSSELCGDNMLIPADADMPEGTPSPSQ